jgi:hypothetical protein
MQTICDNHTATPDTRAPGVSTPVANGGGQGADDVNSNRSNELRRKCGAPRGNQHNTRHGLRLVVNGLPPGCTRLEGDRRKLRRLLESLVETQKGEITIVDAALISTIIRWETHSALCARWLRHALAEGGKGLTHADKLGYSREVARASSERDKCIKALGVGKKATRDVLADLYDKAVTVDGHQDDGIADRPADESTESGEG